MGGCTKMKIQFIIVGWHYNQMEFYEGLKEMAEINDVQVSPCTIK